MIRSWSIILQLCNYLGTVHYKESETLHLINYVMASGSLATSYRSGEVDFGCLLQLLARRYEPIAGHCGQVMIGTSITDDNVPPCIQSVIDMSGKSLGLTTRSGGGSLKSQPCWKWFGGMFWHSIRET